MIRQRECKPCELRWGGSLAEERLSAPFKEVVCVSRCWKALTPSSLPLPGERPQRWEWSTQTSRLFFGREKVNHRDASHPSFKKKNRGVFSVIRWNRRSLELWTISQTSPKNFSLLLLHSYTFIYHQFQCQLEHVMNSELDARFRPKSVIWQKPLELRAVGAAELKPLHKFHQHQRRSDHGDALDFRSALIIQIRWMETNAG